MKCNKTTSVAFYQICLMTLLRGENAWTAGRCRLLSGGGMVLATTCVTRVDCTTRWTASTGLSSNPRGGWWGKQEHRLLVWMGSVVLKKKLNSSNLCLVWGSPLRGGWVCPAPTVTPQPQPCGGETQKGSRSATPAASTWNSTGWEAQRWAPKLQKWIKKG